MVNQRGTGGAPTTTRSRPASPGASGQAGKVVEEVGDTARETVARATETAKQQADTKREKLGGGLERVAQTMHQTGNDLRQKNQAMVGDYLDQAAGQVEKVSDYLRGHSVDQIISDVDAFARREPAITIGVALGLGFLAARLLKASLNRANPSRQTGSTTYRTPAYSADNIDPLIAESDATQEVALHERRIEQTRSAMTDTVSELHDRLSPGTLAGNAGNAVKDATVGRSGRFLEDMAERVKANPLPAALIGAGLAWMWMGGHKKDDGSYHRRGLSTAPGSTPSGVAEGIRQRAGDAVDQVSGTINDVAGTVQGSVSDATQQARAQLDRVGMQAQRAQTTMIQTIQENPLPVALAAIGIGALIGGAVPTTNAEQRVLQPVGDQLSQQASQLGSKVGQVADRAQTAARDEAQRQNLS